MKNKPVRQNKLGSLTLSVWNNKTDNNTEYKTYTLVRSYKDNKGEWQNTNTLREIDLVVAKHLIEKELGSQ